MSQQFNLGQSSLTQSVIPGSIGYSDARVSQALGRSQVYASGLPTTYGAYNYGAPVQSLGYSTVAQGYSQPQLLRGSVANVNTISGLQNFQVPQAHTVQHHVEHVEHVEVPTTEQRQIQVQTTEFRTIEVPTTERRTIQVPTTETRTIQVPSTEIRTIEVPRVETRQIQVPSVERRQIEVPKIEHKVIEVPKMEIRQIQVPTTERRTIQVQTTELRTIEVPTTETRTIQVPTVERRQVEVPKVETRQIQVPTTETRVIEVPSVERRQIEVPKIETRTVEVPGTQVLRKSYIQPVQINYVPQVQVGEARHVNTVEVARHQHQVAVQQYQVESPLRRSYVAPVQYQQYGYVPQVSTVQTVVPNTEVLKRSYVAPVNYGANYGASYVVPSNYSISNYGYVPTSSYLNTLDNLRRSQTGLSGLTSTEVKKDETK